MSKRRFGLAIKMEEELEESMKKTYVAKVYDSILLTSKDVEFIASSKEEATQLVHGLLDGHKNLRLVNVKEKE